MASFEILSGDFERRTVRIRYSSAGRAFLHLTSVDGRAENVFLATDVIGADTLAAGEGPVFGEGGREPSGRSRFRVHLRDGRSFVGYGVAATIAEIGVACRGGEVIGRSDGRADAASEVVAPLRSGSFMGRSLPRLFPALFARRPADG